MARSKRRKSIAKRQGKFIHERIYAPSTLKRKGYTLIRSKKMKGGTVIRLYCKPKRKGCQLQAILHPKNDPDWHCGHQICYRV